jgi:chemotaxis protein histidine kinase CheA
MGKAMLQSDLDTRLAELAVTFLQRTAIAVATFPRLIERVDNRDVAVMKELETTLHGIHGGGAMFGFHTISDQAGTFERLVVALRTRVAVPPGITAPMLRRLKQCAQRLTRETAAAQQAPAVRR